MRREISGIIGLVGGLIDLWAGSSILAQSSMGMVGTQAYLFGYFLLLLGVIVLLTGLLMFTGRSMGQLTGPLMIFYGLAMLVLGVGMISGLLDVMMQSSLISGMVMVGLGLLMLYSGSGMARRSM